MEILFLLFIGIIILLVLNWENIGTSNVPIIDHTKNTNTSIKKTKKKSDTKLKFPTKNNYSNKWEIKKIVADDNGQTKTIIRFDTYPEAFSYWEKNSK